MKKLMTFFALVSIIILAIPINSYGWLTGFEGGKNDPFQIYYYGQYLPSLRDSNLITEYGTFSEYGILPNNMPNGPILNHAQLYGGNQPYNNNWNQSYGYGGNQPYNYNWNQSYGYGGNQPYNYNWNQSYGYGGNQPYNYNYGWNQPYGYGYYDGFNTYQANTYDSDDSDDSDD